MFGIKTFKKFNYLSFLQKFERNYNYSIYNITFLIRVNTFET